MLWGSAVEQGFSAPLWLTYKQPQELGGQVRKGEKGSLVVYANTISRTETDKATGEEHERDIPFMKGYTVFNAEGRRRSRQSRSSKQHEQAHRTARLYAGRLYRVLKNHGGGFAAAV